MDKSLILCDCSGTNHLNSKDLSEVTGLECSQVHTALCTTQIDSAAKAITGGGKQSSAAHKSGARSRRSPTN